MTKKKDKLPITKSSGNVFKDLEVKDADKHYEASKLTFGEFKPLKGTDDFVASLKIDSGYDILEMASKEKFTVKELLYQLPANPKGKIKDILLAAITLRAIKNSIKSSKKVK